jgi:hypothetical protein
VFIRASLLSYETGLSRTTLKRYRLQGVWQEGIHWQRLNSRSVLYNKPLVMDWIANRTNPQAHQRAIENYLSSLLSNQPKKRGRRAS